MRRAAKVDDNQTQIVNVFRRAGCSVQILSAVGQGCPDILVGISGFNILVEIKDGAKPPSDRKLTKDQVIWHTDWRGQVAVIATVDEAISLINLVRRSGTYPVAGAAQGRA